MTENLIRDFFEFLIVVAVGAMAISAVVRVRRGQVRAYCCAGCGSLISRAYPRCPKCGAEEIRPA